MTPPEYLQKGDPPLGNERGALGVGTGPTPPKKPSKAVGREKPLEKNNPPEDLKSKKEEDRTGARRKI